jgi:solute carrier family 15 oligopeptide transporter 1|uniref:Oligopeptide transporter 1 n=1 Tax=Tenebrio molitor TaxID=7067 RepID=A0A1Y0AWT5_TENMO|nr:proton-dependent oligopeptide transporter 2 [Tenebrio molitor]
MGGESDEKTENGHVSTAEDKPKVVDDVNTEEAQNEHVPYPKSVFFIISNEFCERFSFYGMRTILSLYLRDILLFTESDSTVIYHVFTMFAYFFPLLGAIVSDSWLGKFRTILYVSMIYACGNILLALSSATPIGIPQVPFSLIALLLIALGTGGIKPCVSAFGGDQFVLPQQQAHLVSFFSIFYFSINAGSLISTFLTPVLREDVHCFDEDSCYPLAFAIPGILMIVSIIIFFLGMPLYKIRKPEGNVVVQVVKCIWYGAKKNFRSEDKREHWLDHAEDKFGRTLVEDVKMTLKVLVIFVPLPIFYALYDQQGSGWTFQAARMDGRLGSFTILPDQMQVVNPLLILVFIPLFNYGVYPFLAKFNLLKTPLQRMVCGGLFTAVAFGVSAVISLTLEATYPELPAEGQCQLRIYNPYKCSAEFAIPDYNVKETIDQMGYKLVNLDGISGEQAAVYEVTSTCMGEIKNNTRSIILAEETGYVVHLSELGILLVEDDISKPEDGLPRIRTLVGNPVEGLNLTYYDEEEVALIVPTTNNSLFAIDPGTYKLGNKEFEFNMGGVYTIVISLDGKDIGTSASFEITEPNSVHMLLLLPQYIIITAGEIMFAITGLEFSYSQAPVSMKSVLQACFLLTSAIGNLIIVIIESAKIFDKQSYDFFLYTGLMVLDMIILAFMAVRYKYVKKDENEENTNDDIKPEKKLSNKPPIENNDHF